MREIEHDIVIVGGGSAGCVLANRLSADPGLSVALLEAGPPDRNPWLHVPIGFSRTFKDPSVNWCFETQPQAQLHGRTIFWPRGRVLGGSSAINGMIHVRGHPQDFDGWARGGLPGWSWAEVLPYFQRSEGQTCGLPEVYGSDGPLGVASLPVRNRATQAFVQAAAAAGLPPVRSFNTDTQEGAGEYQINTRGGWRSSTATAYLRPVRRRPNLSVMTGALATRLCLAGDRVEAVEALMGGECIRVRARESVVVCAGAVGSPALLQRSGIGHPQDLHRAGIEVKLASPRVGHGLQDHFGVRYIARLRRPWSINDDFRRPWRLLRHAWRYAVHRDGQLAIGGAEAGAFARCDPQAERPDVQFHFLPLSSERGGWSFHPFSGVTANVCQLRPWSRGRVWVDSADPLRAPRIDPAYLSDPRDGPVLVAGLRLARRIFACEPLAGLLQAEHWPGEQARDDDALLEHARRHGSTVFHPVGGCAMGPSEDDVLDARCRVRGLRGLRVADASAFPSIVSGNTNAAVVMLAERVAEMIGEDHPP